MEQESTMTVQRDPVMRRVYKTRGLASAIAREVGVTPKAVQQWKKVPPHWVQTVADIINMKPEDIRPDIFKPRKKAGRS
jgi:DNA-binding transcriptional regulator YdaS (Cro superfamily)